MPTYRIVPGEGQAGWERDNEGAAYTFTGTLDEAIAEARPSGEWTVRRFDDGAWIESPNSTGSWSRYIRIDDVNSGI